MKLIVCSIKDHAIDAFLAPWYARTQSEAIRQFNLACTVHDTPMRAHPADYDLFQLGIWDDHTGKTENTEAPILLARGSNTKTNSQHEPGPRPARELELDIHNLHAQ